MSKSREVVPTGAKIMAVVMIPVIAGLNYVTGVIVETLKLPIWGDTWATMLGTLISGVWVGAIGGFLYNLIMAMTVWGLPAWIWGTCNIAIAIWSFLFMKLGWDDLKKPLKLIPAFLWLGFIYTIQCTAIGLYMFGAGPLPKPTAVVYFGVLSATGNQLLAYYLQNVATELIDKSVSWVLALIVASRVPKRFILAKR